MTTTDPRRDAVARVQIHRRREIVLPDDMIVERGGKFERGPLAGSYVKGATAAAIGAEIDTCPYPAGADMEAWRRGFEAVVSAEE